MIRKYCLILLISMVFFNGTKNCKSIIFITFDISYRFFHILMKIKNVIGFNNNLKKGFLITKLICRYYFIVFSLNDQFSIGRCYHHYVLLTRSMLTVFWSSCPMLQRPYWHKNTDVTITRPKRTIWYGVWTSFLMSS